MRNCRIIAANSKAKNHSKHRDTKHFATPLSSACGSECQGFESLRAPSLKTSEIQANKGVSDVSFSATSFLLLGSFFYF
jgi:hypothetical protein